AAANRLTESPCSGGEVGYHAGTVKISKARGAPMYPPLKSVQVGLVLLVAAWPAAAQEKASKYPKVNAAVAYEVDASWPQKPPHVSWAEMSGIAVDAHDNVYLFTRARPPVQVYTAEGKFLRAWGEDTIKSAHHIKIDEKGNVWIADIGHHVVRKFTPNGK